MHIPQPTNKPGSSEPGAPFVDVTGFPALSTQYTPPRQSVPRAAATGAFLQNPQSAIRDPQSPPSPAGCNADAASPGFSVCPNRSPRKPPSLTPPPAIQPTISPPPAAKQADRPYNPPRSIPTRFPLHPPAKYSRSARPDPPTQLPK